MLGRDEAALLMHGRQQQILENALPSSVPAPPRDWGTPYARLARQVGLDPDVSAAHAAVGHFLDPLLDGTVGDDSRWEPTTGHWERAMHPAENEG